MNRRATRLASVGALLVLGAVSSAQAQAPTEVMNLQWCAGSNSCLQWSPTATATNYHLDRGVRADLPGLLTNAFDSCDRRSVSAASASGLSENPPSGELYWYLVVAANPCGVGPAGNATPGPRILDPQNNCEPACTNGSIDLDETDTDCGGSICSSCGIGNSCLVGSDCQSGVCSGLQCAAPTCGDTVLNGSETGGDCGGGACPTCANGAGCCAPSDCQSNCVDGVCCDSACTGLCQACSAVKKGSGADGVCGTVGAGMDPDNECAGAATCNGAGACAFPDGVTCSFGGQCASGNCVDGVCCNTSCINVCQACSAAKKGSGTDGTCGNIGYGGDPDNECFDTTVCNGSGNCGIANGWQCASNAQCASGNCADGVCCNTPCNGLCQGCTTAKKRGGQDGTCGNIPNRTDPDNECGGAETCTGGGTCALESVTACSIPAECQSGNCVDGFCCNSSCSGFCEACSAAKKGTGIDGACGYIVFTDPDHECPGTLSCNGTGACQAPRPNGTSCTLNLECASGNCVDFVCCNSPCNGLCQACTAIKKGTGVNGVCGYVASGTDPDDDCFSTMTCDGAGHCSP